MATLENITKQTAEYAKTRRAALDLAGQLQAQIEAVQAKFNKALTNAVTKMTLEHEALSKAIEASAHLFDTTKSITVEGIKVGFQVGKEKLKIQDTDQAATAVFTLIDQLYEEGNVELAGKLETTVKVKYTLVDAALKRLDADVLTNLGITVVPATNDVLIKPQDSDTTKAVDDIIKAVLSEVEA
jgi:hypothetical protein